MANITNKKGVIAILTGGGDVPGLNPAIRAITIRAIKEGYRVIGIRRGWAGLIEMTRHPEADNQEYYTELTEEIVDRVGRTGGIFFTPRAPGQAVYPMLMCPFICGTNTIRKAMI